MPIVTPIHDLVAQLRRANLRPSERLMQEILDRGAEARDSLLELACTIDLLDEEEPLCWAPIHALRLLGEMMDEATAVTLLEVLPIEIEDPDEMTPRRMWVSDILMIIGRGGAAIAPLLWARAYDPEVPDGQRGAAVAALAFVSAVAPELHDEIVATAYQHLQHEESADQIAHLIHLLSSLGAQQYYREIMALYREKRVSTHYISAGVARQWLLGGGDKGIRCATHSLNERYDEHGPFEYEEA